MKVLPCHVNKGREISSCTNGKPLKNSGHGGDVIRLASSKNLIPCHCNFILRTHSMRAEPESTLYQIYSVPIRTCVELLFKRVSE